jgi:hypothetical protein
MVNVAVEGGSNRSMVGTFKFGRFEFPAEQLASPRPHIAPTIARDILMSDLLAQKRSKNVARMNEVKSVIVGDVIRPPSRMSLRSSGLLSSRSRH